MDLINIMSSNYTTHNIFLINKKQNIINKGDDIMSYYLDHTLKLTFKEYNKFVKHCKEYMDPYTMIGYNITKEDLKNGEFMDKLFDDFEINDSTIAISNTERYGSPTHKMIYDYVNNKCDENEWSGDFGYAYLGEDSEDVSVIGSIPDRPRLTIDSDMGVNNKKIKKGVLMIIID